MTREDTRLVRSAFRADELRRICALDDFAEFAPRTEIGEPGRFYHYRNNGSPILGIAHLDSVQTDGTCRVVRTTAGLLALSGSLDDRLGAYVILDLLPRLGVTVDWLLTTDEEIGRSTAADFSSPKPYNWMFQFDRAGTDVVMYEYETAELRGLVNASGARVGLGSFSDICMLDQLGCAGFNWGVGYQDYHSRRSHAWLTDTFKMVTRFLRFYAANQDVHLASTPKFPRRWFEDLDDELLFDRCPVCYEPTREGYCPDCAVDWLTEDCRA